MQRYPHWVRYDRHSLDLDFREYKKKEEAKWRGRADRYGFRFPIFDSKEQLESELESSPIVQIDKIGYVGNKTVNSSIEDIEDMVSRYYHPRDVQRIALGFAKGDQIPLPIVLKGSKGQFMLSGNTRQATARVMDIVPEAILLDVSE